MQSDDKPINGQPINGQDNPNFLDLLNQTPPPPDAKDWPRPKRFAGLREAWDASWKQGGFLYERWEELFQARRLGWHEMANWIKAVLSLAGICAFIVLLDAASDIVSAVLHRLSATRTVIEPPGVDTTSGLWGVIDNPIRSYIGQHSVGLPVPGSAVYAFWQFTGLIGLIGGFAGSTGARILWTGWGLSGVAMVWSSATPDGSRTVATGIAALLWALASIFALRGLSLRPVINNPAPAAPQVNVYPAFHFPPQPTPDHDDLDDEPDNVHPLQR
ncbi:hypothetical protein GCM10018980_68690 [Streptomyces capoamus]|uniref:Uncharacterized protein n=1 Tax=Streptomyces capoamus TaxID=68183 RepID=A0A919KFP0_9ACTN|nr:hypothetical protein [Streptomyces capoamus]GGP32336.1 hypothetical protein GCM10010501_74680 [Streptomyces libani subsp. rufus]GHG72698.1 hypothetical protein GCM10018980_68690 [Streptomyces capoamus]